MNQKIQTHNTHDLKATIMVFLTGILLIGITVFNLKAVFSLDRYYPVTLRITETSETNFKAETSTGIEYTIQNPPEDLNVGEVVSVLMYDNKTENVLDDIPVKVKYSAFEIRN